MSLRDENGLKDESNAKEQVKQKEKEPVDIRHDDGLEKYRHDEWNDEEFDEVDDDPGQIEGSLWHAHHFHAFSDLLFLRISLAFS